MKLILITGASASGKVTIGQELAKITGFYFMHNHIAIEPVVNVFGNCKWGVINCIREVFFDEFNSMHVSGLIITLMASLSSFEDIAYIEEILERFDDVELFIIRLEAPFSTRINRLVTTSRLENKPSQRDLQRAKDLLLKYDNKYATDDSRFKSYLVDDFHFLILDTENISPADNAGRIVEKFGFKRCGDDYSL